MSLSNHRIPVLHIAFIVFRFPELSESFILDQITGMLDQGQDVKIYAVGGPPDDVIHHKVNEYRLLERTRYLPKGARSRLGLLRQASEALLKNPELIGWSIARSKRRPGEVIRSIVRARGFVQPRDAKIDLVHCQYGSVARHFGFTKSLCKAKMVVSFRGHDFSSLPRIYGADMYQEVFHQADAVTAVCKYAAMKVIDLGCPPEKLVVHYSGTDLEEFAFQERQPEGGREIRLLTVARLVEMKGLEFALRAVANLVFERKLDLRYAIVGEGPLRGELETLARALHIEGRVRFFGAQPSRQVRDLMQQYHLFVLPSVTPADGSQEGIPGSVREAMATGMPVVSTMHSGIPELVSNGVTGFLVPEGDVDALSQRLHDLVTHPEWWSAMGRAGREQVERHFEIRRLNRRLEALYRHILAGGIPAEFEFSGDSGVTSDPKQPKFLSTNRSPLPACSA